MKVPTVDTQVTPEAPNAPEVQAPRPIEAAYGASAHLAAAEVGRAVSGIGDVLAQHAEKQAYWNAQVQGYQGLEAYKKTMQDHEDDEGTKTVLNNTGQKVEMPLGYKYRTGAFASGQLFPNNGLVEDFDKDSAAAKASILKTLSPMAQTHFLRTADYYTEGFRQKYISFEVKQKEAYDTGVFNGQIKNKVMEAQAAMDPESLKTVIDGRPGVDGLLSLNDKLGKYRQEAPETTQVNGQKHLLDAVMASAVSTLRNTGDLDRAQKQVDAFADRMNPGDSAKLQETLTGMKHHLDQQNEFQVKAQQEKTDSDFAQRWVSGDPDKMPTQKELDDAHVLGAAGRPGGISQKLYEAIKAGNKTEPITQEEKDQKLVDLSNAHAMLLTAHGTLDTNARFSNVAEYKAKLIDAYNAKAISNATFLKSLGVVSKVYDKGLDGEVNKAFGQGNAVSSFLDNALRYMHGQPALDKDPKFLAAKAFVGKELLDRMNEGGIPQGQASDVAQQILSKYIESQKPEVLGAKQVPNNVASKKGGVEPLHTSPVASFSDRTISAPKVPEAKQITQENLEYTAKVMNMTVDEVKKKLGIKEDANKPSSA